MKTKPPTPTEVKAELRRLKAKGPKYNTDALMALGKEIGLGSRKGFTLMELLVVLCILLALVVAGIKLAAFLFE